MALPSGAHVSLGGVEYLLDEGYEAITGRRCYSHGGRSIFAERFDIAGSSGRALRQDRLLWYTTRFSGEGQVVLDGSDPDAASLFYRSEGLNFRVPGEVTLNKSTLSQTVTVSAGSDAEDEGNTWTDITGTSTSSGTNRRLNVVGDKIASPTNFTPGTTTNVAKFYGFREAFSDYATTIQGSAFNGGITSATDKLVHTTISSRSDVLTGFTAGRVYRFDLFLYVENGAALGTPTLIPKIYVLDVTDPDRPIVRHEKHPHIDDASGPSTANVQLNITPADAGQDFRIVVMWNGDYEGFERPAKDTALVIDKIEYGEEITSNSVTVEVYNQSTSATVKTKRFDVTATSAGKIIGSLTWPGVAATNYRFRVTRSSGRQRVWVDKVSYRALANAVYSHDCLDFGVGQKIWLGASTAAADSKGFVYDTTNDEWDDTSTFNDATATTGAAVIGMAHSDSLEYFCLDNDEIYTSTSGGTDDRYARFTGNTRQLRGIAVSQNRLMVLAEDTTGVRVYAVPLDLTGATTPATPVDLNESGPMTTGVTFTDIDAGSKSPDAALRQRMCASPGGALFFVNYSDATAKVYAVDASGTTLDHRELADLGTGVKATCIAYEGGITFVGGLFFGSSGTSGAATDVDMLARPALWAIDQNGVLQRIGFFRRDDPAAGAPSFLVPFQTDLYALQTGIDAAGSRKGYVWRYSLVTGGVFNEYELPVETATAQRALAVIPGRTVALYSDEIFTTGSSGTYRISSAPDGNSHVSSIYDNDLPNALKTLVKVDVLTDTMPANTRINVEYQIDQDGTWVLLGTVTSGKRNTLTGNGVTYTTIQLRTTLSSTDGVSTPNWKANVVEARAAEDEEYFDLVLLTEDADSSFRIPGDQMTGDAKAQNVIGLWRSGAPVTFVDGYISEDLGITDTYLVTIGDLRDERTKQGEGRLVATLKVVR